MKGEEEGWNLFSYSEMFLMIPLLLHTPLIPRPLSLFALALSRLDRFGLALLVVGDAEHALAAVGASGHLSMTTTFVVVVVLGDNISRGT